MKNPATNVTRDDFNVFTLELQRQIRMGRNPLVKLRDGRIVPVSWFSADGPDYEYFVYVDNARDTYLIWQNDGTSITSKSFDMMESYDE